MNNKTNSDLNRELDKAVIAKDLQRVRAVLLRGADANFIQGSYFRQKNQETLLHDLANVEIAKELILHGAQINKTNICGETPLHTAISRKSFEYVSLLLKNGAHVNRFNSKGDTPLHILVKRMPFCKNQKTKFMKVLLEYGADINLGGFYFSHTPLDIAMRNYNSECVKLFIRYTLIQRISVDFKKTIDLSPYVNNPIFDKMARYLDDCIVEIVRMQSDEVTNNLCFYELLLPKYSIYRIYPVSVITRAKKLSANYPIYKDILSQKIQLYFERSHLMNKLSEQEIYIRADDDATTLKEVHLNFDTVCYIALYLSTEDLSNFVTAVDVKKEPDLGHSVKLPTCLDETCDISCTKRAKY